MDRASAYADAESPAEDYEKTCQDYETCARLCSHHFAGVTEADAVFRKQQSDLYDLLTAADTVWDQLQGARQGGGTQKKSAAAMQSKIDMMKRNLLAQDSSLSVVEKELKNLAAAITKYQNSISDSRSEHGRIKGAIEARAKTMRKMLKSIEAGAAEKKTRAHSADRKDPERTSPDSSRASPRRAASPPKASKTKSRQ
jgi:predicted  nucleic acid-binding Zn-ribbon protein